MNVLHSMHPRHDLDFGDGNLHGLPAKGLRIFVRVLVILLLSPVLFLYAGTAVSWLVTILLLGLDALFLWWLWHGANTRGIALLIVGLVCVASVTMRSSRGFAAPSPIPNGDSELLSICMVGMT